MIRKRSSSALSQTSQNWPCRETDPPVALHTLCRSELRAVFLICYCTRVGRISQWLTGDLHSLFTRFSKSTRCNQRRLFVDSFPALLRSLPLSCELPATGINASWEWSKSLLWHILSALSYAIHRDWTLSIFHFFPPNHLVIFVVCKRKHHNLSVPFLLE